MTFAIILLGIVMIPLSLLIWRSLAVNFKWADCAFIRNISCKGIGRWHGPTTVNSFDGCSMGGKCDWCGYEGLFDGNGDLF